MARPCLSSLGMAFDDARQQLWCYHRVQDAGGKGKHIVSILKRPQKHGCGLWICLVGCSSADHDLVIPVGFNLLSPEVFDEVPLARRN
jgi:hypothetical protein